MNYNYITPYPIEMLLSITKSANVGEKTYYRYKVNILTFSNLNSYNNIFQFFQKQLTKLNSTLTTSESLRPPLASARRFQNKKNQLPWIPQTTQQTSYLLCPENFPKNQWPKKCIKKGLRVLWSELDNTHEQNSFFTRSRIKIERTWKLETNTARVPSGFHREVDCFFFVG